MLTLSHKATRPARQSQQSLADSHQSPHPYVTSDSFATQLTSFDCPVCLSELVCPKITPCGHSLCGTCAKQLFNSHSSRYNIFQQHSSTYPLCPLCRDPIHVESSDDLPTNYALQNIIESWINSELCSESIRNGFNERLECAERELIDERRIGVGNEEHRISRSGVFRENFDRMVRWIGRRVRWDELVMGLRVTVFVCDLLTFIVAINQVGTREPGGGSREIGEVSTLPRQASHRGVVDVVVDVVRTMW
eukprot:CAMPEP_0182444786 /NCGR_PEP_ID=MMETSP1172-20130603/3128_1 /TAXON_ID=708627 /ORGANISM="Timspurckia oligopyrenoides, Strain CCMP3278" /LENGTH=248 /DNA_ID=CAMNT_0024640425 /DNA_START=298 /DNA_END=1041 /DNA_ORIENTATION=+